MKAGAFLEEYRKRSHLVDPVKITYGRTKPTNQKHRVESAIHTARRTPQAVFKLISKIQTARLSRKTCMYIARDGELELEGRDNEQIIGADAIDDLIDSWKPTFNTRKNAVNTLHLLLSTPAGTDPEAVTQAARNYCADQLGDRDYVFVRHNDTDNPHVHILAKNRDDNNKPLPVRKADLIHYREAWIFHCRSVGIDVAASYRSERGVFTKGISTPIRKMQDRGETLHRDKTPEPDKPYFIPQIRSAARVAQHFLRYSTLIGINKEEDAEAVKRLLAKHAEFLRHTALSYARQLYKDTRDKDIEKEFSKDIST